VSELDDPTDSPVRWVRDHIRKYVESDGRRGHRWSGADTLLLTTMGRRTGEPRRTPLIYGRDGDRYVIVGSKGGSPKHPLWYLNLVADPQVRIQVGRDARDLARVRPVPDENVAGDPGRRPRTHDRWASRRGALNGALNVAAPRWTSIQGLA
jgi:deazaflavin-dependent oxidoreductase (nitroreductase family)